MNRALLSGLSSLLFPFAAHAAATPAGGYLMRGGYQPGRHARLQLDASSRAFDRPHHAKPHRPPAATDAAGLDIVQPAAISELVVIDGAVADKATLYRGLRPGVAAVEIDPSRPGLPQLAAALSNYRDLAAVHVVSHAWDGELQLGSSRVTSDSVLQQPSALAALRQAVRAGGDLLFYGCDLAAGDKGAALLDIVHRQTGLDVAASSNPTGSPALGADWTLEIQRGHIDTPVAFSDKARADFSEVLVAADGTRNFAGWSGALSPQLSTTDFRLTARNGNGSTPNVGIYAGGISYMLTNAANDNSGHYLYVKADGTNTTGFELTGLNAGEYTLGEFTNLRVVGMVRGGGTIQSGTVNSVGGSGEAFAFGPAQLAAFAGVKLQGFKLYFDCEGSCAANETAYLEFRNFTIANAIDTPLAPTVTDARISISGASGTGGAYKINDTVTASWNNSAGGDNNSGITGVTVDFSQFGGPSAVTATNSGGVWTAAYTIVAGSIDATNRNVSVTATNAGGSTTTADTTNATVDNIAPVVTPGNIALSGASGVGGVFKAGDTVIAQWNNTAAGDNNTDTISAVSINLSAFNGPVAIPATNAAGIWTATHPLPAGVAGNNLNASISAVDNAGNITTTASTANATVDTLVPAVSSIAVSGSPAPGDASVAFTATFNKPVTNISTDDFTLIGTGTASGTISSVSASTGSSVNVNVSGITGTGTIKINLNGSTNIADSVGNGPPASFNSGGTHTVAVPVAPGAPTGATATAGNAQASITFAAPASNGGSAISTYTAVASGGGGQTGSCPGPAACTITVPGLTNGISYSFNVSATNSAGLTGPAATSNNVTPQGTQTISFAPAASYNFGTTPTLTATSSAGASYPVSFTSSTTGVCTITPTGSLTFVTAGSCSINANQAGDAATSAAPQVSQTFNVNAVAPGAPTIGTATAGNAQATVSFTAPASTGGAAVTYTATSSPGSFTATGSSPITVPGLINGTAYTFSVTAANSAGPGSPSAASNAVTPRASQTISFTPAASYNFGTTPTLTATSSAGASYPVSFTSSTTGVCTITPTGSLTFVTAGSCSINANQAGDAATSAAPQVSQTFNVNAVAPGAPTIGTATAGNAQATVSFTAPASTGGAAVTYTATSSPGSFTATGSSPITVPGLINGTAYTFSVTAANSAGPGSPSAASNAVTPRASQTISFTPAASYNFGTTPTLTATSSAGASYPVSFTSSTTGVCTITPTGSLTFVTAGNCTIAADQAGDAAISAAPQVTQSFAVNAIAPDIPVIGTVTAADAQATVNFTASVGSGGAPISGYTVTATPVAVPGAPSVTTQTGTASPIVVTGLTNGFVYNFTVKATNGAQTSADSAAVQATPRKLELVGAPGSVPGMAGTPTATLSGGGATCTLQATGGFGPAASTPPGLQAPNGQFSFTAEQCTGAVTMTLVYPSPLPVGVQFRKPDGAGGWFDPTNAATSLNVVLNAARTTVSYTITDNGLGDTNPATGTVSDPFVPVVAAVAPGGAQAIPSLGGWALAMLSGLLGGLALRSRKVFTARR
ncbi:hypothetical protein A4F85_09315 [Delftia sp. GW456-R20]|uniref:DUF4347 domain-containing protein n=1 Tax=Delftia sp. GW456-R20 TaxID=1827145 RepID=UPI0007AE6751|nr:DUF4347 domain-containing protein [Delftia sp. GW456-R20]KZK28024.1 hypothetical protein A4F85_09315 [Delftia sp. GW456-R20]